MSDWQRSSFCGTNACVEVLRHADGSVRVRNSKFPLWPSMAFTAEEWADFVAGVQAGEFGGEAP